jgi:Uma2 family endonuclease
MEATAHSEQLFTVAEYIEFEEKSEIRHEFHQGRLFPIVATTDVHNEIIQNITALLYPEFRKRGCKFYHENVKLQIVENGKYNYPDIMLTCDEQDAKSRFIKRFPSLIIEVLSKSTAAYDRDGKFKDYQTLPSIQYYLLVESRWQSVELFSRTEQTNLWTYQNFSEPNDIVTFPKLDFKLSVSDIYADLNLPRKLLLSRNKSEEVD